VNTSCASNYIQNQGITFTLFKQRQQFVSHQSLSETKKKHFINPHSLWICFHWTLCIIIVTLFLLKHVCWWSCLVVTFFITRTKVWFNSIHFDHIQHYPLWMSLCHYKFWFGHTIFRWVWSHLLHYINLKT